MSGTGSGDDRMDDRISELIALAALGEITAEEEAELDALLEDDPALVRELDADLDVAAFLQSALAEQPPAHLKSAVSAAIDALGDSSSTAEPPDPAEDPAVRSTIDTPNSVVDFAAGRDSRTARRSTSWQLFAAAAAVVTLVVGGVLVAGRGAGEVSSFDAIVQADDGERRSLSGELDGTLDVVFSPSQGAFALDGEGVPTLSETETYQVWFVDDDGPRSVGLFRPDDAGRVEIVFEDFDPSEVVVGVTIEPAGGSDAPTLPIVASA
jgi:anti-sigma-K factor RskA